MKVSLREKKLKNGMRSLYLDFYPPIIVDGNRTRREFLKLYVYEKPKTEIERNENKETRLLAENIRSKRLLDLQANPHGYISPRRRNANFLTFFKEVVDRRQKSPAAFGTWKNILIYLTDFCDGQCTFAQVDRDFVEKFRLYLQTCEPYKIKLSKARPKSRSKSQKQTLAPNTAKSYFERFRSAVREAHRKNYLSADPTIEVESIKGVTPKREFLLLDELVLLAKTQCEMPEDLRRAALFSAMTGLRHSDIRNITWANVRYNSIKEHFLSLIIKKTGEPLILPISDEARELLNKASKPEEKVFPNLKYDTMTNVFIGRWSKQAGIGRRITFHCFRRTFATGLITHGTDLFTVQKMLGHSDIRQTQIYANLVDERKREAANKITLK